MPWVHTSFCDAGDYAYVGSTAVITAEPAVVHFGGFQPGQVLQQVVHIINTAPTATRVHVIPPDTTQFTVRLTIYGSCMQHEISLHGLELSLSSNPSVFNRKTGNTVHAPERFELKSV